MALVKFANWDGVVVKGKTYVAFESYLDHMLTFARNANELYDAGIDLAEFELSLRRSAITPV